MGNTMKRIILLIVILLIATGCTCEYNLKIDNNKYSEEIIINAKTVSEKDNFSNNWEIPINKDDYDIGLDTESDDIDYSQIYNYRTSRNSLIFNYDFNRSEYNNSTAVYNCYNKLTVSNQSGSTIISTSREVLCFDKYPNLTDLTINITVDRPVKSNNADSVSGNTYTWNINRNNASNKPINLVLESSENNDYVTPTPSSSNSSINTEEKKDYSTYILSAILLLLFLIGYAIYNKMKNKEDKI